MRLKVLHISKRFPATYRSLHGMKVKTQEDPSYYPHKVTFEPVTSVPYWDERCGKVFHDTAEFPEVWSLFWEQVQRKEFRIRGTTYYKTSLLKSGVGLLCYRENVA